MKLQLNSRQKKAIHCTDRPLLVLAGAGSGKTRVITEKILHLIRKGEYQAKHIAALTFTNKAAREMKQRLDKSGLDCTGLRVSTFHRLGLDILRREYRHLGYRKSFTLYDGQDSASLVQELMRKTGLQAFEQAQAVHWQISSWKNGAVSPEQAYADAVDEKQLVTARLYLQYSHYLQTYNAFDFDDLISRPLQLFSEHQDILEKWRDRIRYLLVDEYQDTNTSQYQLLQLLVGKRSGLTVVGDDDQSIYGWRGAQSDNLDRLKLDYKGLEVVLLEQNYRSMNNILLTANHLIANNPHVFEKRLWSEQGAGDPVRILTCKHTDHEAERVVSQLLHHRFQKNTAYSAYAILYRGNHQSRPFERLLREHQIPYKISGGTSFFERSEIKDLFAYCRLAVNVEDDAAFLRVINTPKRGLGPATMEKLTAFAQQMETSLLLACYDDALGSHLKPDAARRLREFAQWFMPVTELAEDGDPIEVIHTLIKETDYENWLRDQSPDPESAQRRLDNVDELIDWCKRLASKNPQHKLQNILNTIQLLDRLDRDEDEEQSNQVQLMTLHAAKGLEFDHVFLVGVEEELLPHRNCMDEAGIEEERRLAYVGITRARQTLTLTHARQRKRYGEIIDCEPSRFLTELPQDLVEWESKVTRTPEQKKETGRAHLAQMRGILAD